VALEDSDRGVRPSLCRPAGRERRVEAAVPRYRGKPSAKSEWRTAGEARAAAAARTFLLRAALRPQLDLAVPIASAAISLPFSSSTLADPRRRRFCDRPRVSLSPVFEPALLEVEITAVTRRDRPTGCCVDPGGNGADRFLRRVHRGAPPADDRLGQGFPADDATHAGAQSRIQPGASESGAYRARTGNLCLAKAALSQLS
jgi:hypothetical protein